MITAFSHRHPHHINLPAINTAAALASSSDSPNLSSTALASAASSIAIADASHLLPSDLHSPNTSYDLNFTPIGPSGLLIRSPYSNHPHPPPPLPHTFASSAFPSFPSFTNPHPLHTIQTLHAHPPSQQTQNNSIGHANHVAATVAGLSPPTQSAVFSNVISPPPPPSVPINSAAYFSRASDPTNVNSGFSNGMNAHVHQPSGFPTPTAPPPPPPAPAVLNSIYTTPQGPPGSSILSNAAKRTVYLGNIPAGTPAEEILNHVRSGPIESVRLLPERNCAFISFLESSAAILFHSDAILKKLSINGQEIKVGWGKATHVTPAVALAVQNSSASRNVYLGGLPMDCTEDEIREDLSGFGPIDSIKLVREKNIAFVHFLSIADAIKAVFQLPHQPKWQKPRRVHYGKDRCAYVSKTQQQNAAQYLGLSSAYAHLLNPNQLADRDLISSALNQQSLAAAAVATSAGGTENLGNRTVYLGSIHPDSTIDEICNVVRGGLLHHVRYIPDKHICFVTFIDPAAAASFFALSNLQGLMLHNRRLKVGWGKHSGALPAAIALAVSSGASRNVYIGNLNENWTEEKLRRDFSEYGEIELVNALREKSCAFVNFTNIAYAIKAIDAIRQKPEYKRFKINFGKDRCGNPPRQLLNNVSVKPNAFRCSDNISLNGNGTNSNLNGSGTFGEAGAQSSTCSSSSSNPMFNDLDDNNLPNDANNKFLVNLTNFNPLTMYLQHIQRQNIHEANAAAMAAAAAAATSSISASGCTPASAEFAYANHPSIPRISSSLSSGNILSSVSGSSSGSVTGSGSTGPSPPVNSAPSTNRVNIMDQFATSCGANHQSNPEDSCSTSSSSSSSSSNSNLLNSSLLAPPYLLVGANSSVTGRSSQHARAVSMPVFMRDFIPTSSNIVVTSGVSSSTVSPAGSSAPIVNVAASSAAVMPNCSTAPNFNFSLVNLSLNERDPDHSKHHLPSAANTSSSSSSSQLLITELSSGSTPPSPSSSSTLNNNNSNNNNSAVKSDLFDFSASLHPFKSSSFPPTSSSSKLPLSSTSSSNTSVGGGSGSGTALSSASTLPFSFTRSSLSTK